jgi:telomere length regulation protein
MLSGFIATLIVLVHASQNAPEWLAVIGPEALELAVTIGTRPIERAEDNIDDEERTEEARSEASVLSNSLELSLVILDACLEQDGGRSLGLEHTALLFGVEEWATQVFGLLEKGIRVVGEGGVQELKLRRAAAGVLVKIDTLKSRWRQSMVDIR